MLGVTDAVLEVVVSLAPAGSIRSRSPVKSLSDPSLAKYKTLVFAGIATVTVATLALPGLDPPGTAGTNGLSKVAP